MRQICLYFQIHQPFRLRKYDFFKIGNDNYYYDDYLNESIIQRVANKCYLPTNKIIEELISDLGDKFKISFSISTAWPLFIFKRFLTTLCFLKVLK